MIRAAFVALILTAPLGVARASHISFEFSGKLGGALSGSFSADFSGFGRRHFHGLFGGFLGRGRPVFGSVNAIQSRFEDRFADLMTEYDDGLADIEDYYSSDEYAEVVDDADRLVNRYDWFVTGVERSIDHLDTFIDGANDTLTFLDGLLAKYEGLSETRFMRIEDWITGLQDRVQLKIDLLTERQTTLTEDLPTYADFQTQLNTYRDEIVLAGGGTMDAEESVSAMRALAKGVENVSVEQTAEASGAVPEPSGGACTALAVAAAPWLARRRRT